MNTAKHSVSDYELPLGRNQWRIVILFRNIASNAFSAHKIKKKKRGKKRKVNEMLNE